MPKKVMKTCPDCKGSGKYVGFMVIEDCRLCKGKGQIVDEEATDRRKRLVKKAKRSSEETKSPFPKAQPGLPTQINFDIFLDPDDEEDDNWWDDVFHVALD